MQLFPRPTNYRPAGAFHPLFQVPNTHTCSHYITPYASAFYQIIESVILCPSEAGKRAALPSASCCGHQQRPPLQGSLFPPTFRGGGSVMWSHSNIFWKKKKESKKKRCHQRRRVPDCWFRRTGEAPESIRALRTGLLFLYITVAPSQ